MGVDEGCCCSGLAATTGTTDLMNIVFDLFGHRKVDHVLDLVEVKALHHHDKQGSRSTNKKLSWTGTHLGSHA